MARELASCGSYLVQGNLIEISVQLLLLHAQTCTSSFAKSIRADSFSGDGTEGAQFVRHFCESISSHEVTVQSLADMMHSVVRNSGPEHPSLVDVCNPMLSSKQRRA